MFRSKKGFTLIELMIVVAILGILAAVAIPKFADLIKKSKEGATKGSLGSIKSAVSIYYGALEGTCYPGSLSSSPFVNSFLDTVPALKLGVGHTTDLSTETNATVISDGGNWWYNSSNGSVFVNCMHTDTKSAQVSSW